MNETFQRESRINRKYNWRRKIAGLKRVTKEMKKMEIFSKKKLRRSRLRDIIFICVQTQSVQN